MTNRFAALNAKIATQHSTFASTPVHDITKVLADSTKGNKDFLKFNTGEHELRLIQVAAMSDHNQMLRNEMNKNKIEVAVEKCINTNQHNFASDSNYVEKDCAAICEFYNSMLPVDSSGSLLAGVQAVDCTSLVALHS